MQMSMAMEFLLEHCQVRKVIMPLILRVVQGIVMMRLTPKVVLIGRKTLIA